MFDDQDQRLRQIRRGGGGGGGYDLLRGTYCVIGYIFSLFCILGYHFQRMINNLHPVY